MDTTNMEESDASNGMIQLSENTTKIEVSDAINDMIQLSENTTKIEVSDAINGMIQLSENTTKIEVSDAINGMTELSDSEDPINVDENDIINCVMIELSENTTDYVDENDTSNSMIELSDIDKNNEAATVALFGSQNNPVEPCCKLLGCNKKIIKDVAVRHRLVFQELAKGEQDLIILSQLQAHRRIPEFQDLYGALTKRKTSRVKKTPDVARKSIKYYFCDVQICQKMFLFIHDVGPSRFENLCRHYDTEGVSFRRHKLTNRPSTNPHSLTPADVYSVKEFITTYADQYGHQLPERLSSFKNFNCVKLPRDQTVSSLHLRYCASIQSRQDVRTIARTTFRRIWQKYCPYITLTKSSG